jgi:hypothetical protein
LGTSPTLGELRIRGISFTTGLLKLFRAEIDRLELYCLFPSTELGRIFSISYNYSYLAPGKAIFNDFKFRGHNIVPIKFTFLLASAFDPYFYELGAFLVTREFYSI